MSEKIFGKSCRNTFCVFSGFCVKIVSRRGAKGAEYVLILENVAHRNHRKPQNFAPHVSAKVCAVCVRQFFSARILCLLCLLCETTPRKDAKGAELYVLLFLCQKSLHTEITENHRILLCMSLRKSAPSA